MADTSAAGSKIVHKLDEFLGQVKIEDILYTKFADELAGQGFSKGGIDLHENNIKVRLRQYAEDRPKKVEESPTGQFADPNYIFSEYLKHQELAEINEKIPGR